MIYSRSSLSTIVVEFEFNFIKTKIIIIIIKFDI